MEQCDLYCLQRSCSETAAKGTDLEEVVGKEDHFELDCILDEFNCFNGVDYVGVLNTLVKYHGVGGGLTYFNVFRQTRINLGGLILSVR